MSTWAPAPEGRRPLGQRRMSDGTRIAYSLQGPEDAPVVVLCDGISCDGFIWRYLGPWLEARFRVLHTHWRGHGLSGLPRDPEDVTVPHLVRDLGELLDAEGLGPATFFGHSMGVQVILETAFRSPERVRGQVLLCGSSGRLLDTFNNTDLGMRLLPRIRSLANRHTDLAGRFLRAVMPTELSYMVALRTELNAELIRRDDFMPYLEHFATMPPDLFVTMLTDAAERSADSFLGRLDVPTLVIAGDRDGFTPTWVTRRLARRLPDAELHVLEGGTHTAPLELPEPLEDLVEAFMDRNGLLSLPEAQARASSAPAPPLHRDLLAGWHEGRKRKRKKSA